MTQQAYDIAIVGAGAVGLSAAYKLSLHNPTLRILVLEKEAEVAQHQTGHNSGVIHSGIYYKPGSYKARNCVQGRDELVRFAQQHQVAHEVCGKVIAAVSEDELPGLEKIYNTGLQNGLSAIQKITGPELREREPFCNAIAGIWVPYTGIIDFVGVCHKLRELVLTANPANRVLTSHPVLRIARRGGDYTLHTPQASFTARYLISCAGLHSDRLARMEGLRPTARIVGFRGDYYDLVPAALHKVRHLIYPVPNPEFPFLGVHFTRMALGGVECGPNAVFTFKREGYAKTSFDLRDSYEALSFAGTWRLFLKHWRFGLNEYHRAFSKAAFLRQIQRLVPSIQMQDLVPGRSGVRAMALAPDGSMIDDFSFAQHERSIHVLNAPSPAATACLAIGSEITRMAHTKFGI